MGNKTDLHQERAVSYEEGKKLAESWRASFLETSAKQNEVSVIFRFFILNTQTNVFVVFFVVCGRHIPFDSVAG